MKSIFEIENRLDIQKEFERFVKVFHSLEEVKLDYYSGKLITLFNYFDVFVFKKWKYRDTMLTTTEYLEHIGISSRMLSRKEVIDEEKFLRYIEFVLNLLKEAGHSLFDSIRDESMLEPTIENIDIVLEKMNYEYVEIEDKTIITKRNADVDSILAEISLPKDVTDVLLEYNDFRVQKDIEAKKKILKKLDLFIEGNIKVKSFDSNLGDSIGVVVNKMGINHPINEEPYLSLAEEDLLQWYDKCFLMMIHAIRTGEVNKIKNERKALENSSK